MVIQYSEFFIIYNTSDSFLVTSLLFSLHMMISSANSELMYLQSVGFHTDTKQTGKRTLFTKQNRGMWVSTCREIIHMNVSPDPKSSENELMTSMQCPILQNCQKKKWECFRLRKWVKMFQTRLQRHFIHKAKIEKRDAATKRLQCSKETISKVYRFTTWEKIITKYTSNKRLISRSPKLHSQNAIY